MNIFFLYMDAIKAAAALCDKHIVRMPMESAQMCSTAVQMLKPDSGLDIYRAAYKNHPMTIWVRQSKANLHWCLQHGLWQCKEYTKRFHRVHASERVLQLIADRLDTLNLPFEHDGFTKPPLCMPDEYKSDDVVESYRRYYIGDKMRFAKWQRSAQPEWWPAAASDENTSQLIEVTKVKVTKVEVKVTQTNVLRRSARLKLK